MEGSGFFTKSKPNKKTNWLSKALTPKKKASGSGLLTQALKLQKKRIAKTKTESMEGEGFFSKAMRKKKVTSGEGGVLVGSTRRPPRSRGGVLVGSTARKPRRVVKK